jgi:hypothetical protein
VVYRERGRSPTPVAPNPPPSSRGSALPARRRSRGPGGRAAAGDHRLHRGGSAPLRHRLLRLPRAERHRHPAGPALNDTNWINIDGSFASIVAVIQNGVMQPVQYPGAMPPGGGGNFDAQQLEALAAYVFALSQQGS